MPSNRQTIASCVDRLDVARTLEHERSTREQRISGEALRVSNLARFSETPSDPGVIAGLFGESVSLLYSEPGVAIVGQARTPALVGLGLVMRWR